MCDCDIIKTNIPNEPSLTLHIKGLTSFLRIVLVVFGIQYRGQTSKLGKQAVFQNATLSPSMSFLFSLNIRSYKVNC